MNGRIINYLTQILLDFFDENERTTLALKLDIRYKDLDGSGPRDRCRNLVEQMTRNGRIDELLTAMEIERPNISPQLNNIRQQLQYSNSRLQLSSSQNKTHRILFISLFVFGLLLIAGFSLYTALKPDDKHFSYLVYVTDNSSVPIKDARVTLSLPGTDPIIVLTNYAGIAEFEINQKFAYSQSRVEVSHNEYNEVFRESIQVYENENTQPELIILEETKENKEVSEETTHTPTPSQTNPQEATSTPTITNTPESNALEVPIEIENQYYFAEPADQVKHCEIEETERNGYVFFDYSYPSPDGLVCYYRLYPDKHFEFSELANYTFTGTVEVNDWDRVGALNMGIQIMTIEQNYPYGKLFCGLAFRGNEKLFLASVNKEDPKEELENIDSQSIRHPRLNEEYLIKMNIVQGDNGNNMLICTLSSTANHSDPWIIEMEISTNAQNLLDKDFLQFVVNSTRWSGAKAKTQLSSANWKLNE